MFCNRCEKKIVKGYKFGVDVFCSKKCLISSIMESMDVSLGKLTEQEMFEDTDVKEQQEYLFKEEKIEQGE